MPRISDMKIWVRLTAAIWVMLVIVWSGMIFWESSVNRQTAIDQARAFSLSMHEATLAGLTAMMVTKQMHKREVLLDQIKQLSIIRDLKVAPGDAVLNEYDPDRNRNVIPPLDDNEKQVLKTGKEFVSVQSDDKGEYLHIVRPALNMKQYLGKSCIKCHEAPENVVLGIISMKVSLDHVNAAVSAQRIKSLVAALVVSLPLLAFIWLFIRNVVTNPLEQMVSGLRSIASGEGDLTRRLEVKGNDEIGQASSVFNEMMAKFADLVRQVGHSAAQVSTSARNLSASAGRVTDSSHQQNDKSDEAAAAVERLVTSISSIAQSAERVHEQSQESLRRSEEGNQSLSKLIGQVSVVETTVQQIAASVGQFVSSTQAITSITREVKDIADQTNLLALNAAIEAARAGEQGRGFAVVADEVRKLAEKSAGSANEIDNITRTLAHQSEAVQRSIEDGLAHLTESQDSLEAVATVLSEASGSVVQVGQGLDAIADATVDQRRVSDEVAGTIEAIAAMARENNGTVEQTSASARELEGLSNDLQSAVGRFKT